MNEGTLKARWVRFAKSKRGRRVLQGVRMLFLLGIVAYLAYELTDLGWAQIGAALPTNPLFYVVFLLLYFSLPLAEVVLYRITWTFDAWRSVPAFIKKRIYNKDVLGYSGEVYFFTWARQHVGLTDLDLLKTIRDQNIVSSIASTVIAVLLVAVFLYTGQINVTDWIGRQELAAYLVGGGAVTLALGAVVMRLRRYLFSMAFATAALIFAVHMARLVIGQGLQIGQWALAMPEVPLRVWFTYAAVSIIVTRIPLIPNRDLIFMGAGVSLSGLMQISEVGVAGMLVAITVLGKVLNLAFFAVLSLPGRRSPKAAASAAEAPAAPRPSPVPEPEEVG